MKEKLQSLKKSMDEFHASYEKMKSAEDEYLEKEMEEKLYEESWKIRSEIYSAMDKVYREMYSIVDDLYSKIYKHEQGHTPKLTAGQMKKFLETVGASEDYEITKPYIYASESRRGIDLVASYRKEV